MPKSFPAHLQKDLAALKSWNSFEKVQDKIDALKFNFGDEVRSPLSVLKHGEAQCLEGAQLAAAAFWYHGERPLILDLRTTRRAKEEFDHVVTLFQYKKHWGAISKTNHAVLRYREPVYRDVRELVMSYFHEYFLDTGYKTLREFSRPLDLSSLNPEWLTNDESFWDVETALDGSPHNAILPVGMEKRLRLAHPVERKAGKVVEWKKE